MTAEVTSLLLADELRLLQQHRPNVMMVGGASWTESLVLALQPTFHNPVTFCRSGTLQALPSTGGTLVLRNVADLTPADQSALFDWLHRDRRRTQVVSTSTRPLVPLLERRLFSDALYYQLNTLYLELPAD